MQLSIDKQISAIMANPCASNWLKATLASALDKDCVDAAKDARILWELLDARAEEINTLNWERVTA
jgi:hypothetical protein